MAEPQQTSQPNLNPFPDYSGVWRVNQDAHLTGAFFLWIHPDGGSTGTALDRYGLARIYGLDFTSKGRVRFDKKYIVPACGAIKRVMRYEGKAISVLLPSASFRKGEFEGKWFLPYSGEEIDGQFTLEPFPRNPTMDEILKANVRKAVQDFGHKAGLDYLFVPVELTPMSKLPGLQRLVALAKI